MGIAAPFGNARTDFASIPRSLKGRIGVKVSGIEGLMLNLSRLKKFPQEGTTRALQVMVSEFMSSLVEFAPVDTGRYINSWKVKEQSANRIVVGPVGMLPARPNVLGPNSAEPIGAQRLATMLEFGTSPHIIAPKNKDHLLFRFKRGGDHITSKPVNHPGTKPRPHIRLALNQTRRKAKGIIYAVATEYAQVPAWKESFKRAARAEGYHGHIPPRQTGRNRKDVSANIGRGTKANLLPKLSRKGFKVKITRRGSTRLVGGFEKGGSSARKVTMRKFGISN